MAIAKNENQTEFQVEFFNNISNFFNADLRVSFDEASGDYLESVSTLIIQAISKKDTYTGGHTKRVGMFAEMICDELDCDDQFKREVAISAVIHDIGKIGIPDQILKKESPLTDEEFEIMKQHPSLGEEILKKIPGFENISLGVSCHHERHDGKGYPKGLKGDEIPLIAKIVSLSDAFDAMISTRPYRKAISPMDAFEMLKSSRGTQFDKKVFDAFEKAFLNSNISKRYRENLKKVG
jgi:HD-GYP domain-containing protein (c-di-GMP phosphodiesterase class II)